MTNGRAHLWQYVLNTSGSPVEGAVASLNLEPTSESVMVYDSVNGNTLYSSISTGFDGRFDMWIPNKSENGYDTNSTFTLTISGTSIDTVIIKNLHLDFPLTSRMIKIDIPSGSWLNMGNNIWNVHITHNLDTLYPIFQLYKLKGNIISSSDLDCGSVSLSLNTNDTNVCTITLNNVTVDPSDETKGTYHISLISAQEGFGV